MLAFPSLNGREFSGGPTRQGLCSGHDLVAVKLHAHTQRLVSTSEPFYSAARRTVSLRERAYRRRAGQPRSNGYRASPNNVA